MPCGCGRQATRREVLRTASNAPTKGGGYLLMTYPDCSTLYRGAWEGTSIYVVGRNTEFERLFKRADLPLATDYALGTKQQIENLPTTGLCQDAVVDVYG